MPDAQNKISENVFKRIRLTVQLTLTAYDAIREIQLQHRREKGRAIPIWRVVDKAVRAYARRQGIEVEE